MKLGLIVRGEDRGLGNQCWEAYRHLRPERTLLVDMGELARGFPVHAERYPGALRADFRGGQLPESEVREWLAGLDVVFTAETFYDWRLCRWADEANVATVCHANPEFYVHHAPDWQDAPCPSAWWVPTTWRLERFSPSATVVPVPVALDRFPTPETVTGRPLRLLHVAGHRAMGDRNGTLTLLQALRGVRQRVHVRLVTQDARLPVNRGVGRHVEVETVTGGVEDYWDLYRDADVLVLPRKYGGLSLPAQEAMAAGLALVMTDCPPQSGSWPIAGVRAKAGATVRTPGGPVTLAEPVHYVLSSVIDRLACDPAEVEALKAASRSWAEAHSWPALLPRYERAFTDAIRANLTTIG